MQPAAAQAHCPTRVCPAAHLLLLPLLLLRVQQPTVAVTAWALQLRCRQAVLMLAQQDSMAAALKAGRRLLFLLSSCRAGCSWHIRRRMARRSRSSSWCRPMHSPPLSQQLLQPAAAAAAIQTHSSMRPHSNREQLDPQLPAAQMQAVRQLLQAAAKQVQQMMQQQVHQTALLPVPPTQQQQQTGQMQHTAPL